MDSYIKTVETEEICRTNRQISLNCVDIYGTVLQPRSLAHRSAATSFIQLWEGRFSRWSQSDVIIIKLWSRSRVFVPFTAPDFKIRRVSESYGGGVTITEWVLLKLCRARNRGKATRFPKSCDKYANTTRRPVHLFHHQSSKFSFPD